LERRPHLSRGFEEVFLGSKGGTEGDPAEDASEREASVSSKLSSEESFRSVAYEASSAVRVWEDSMTQRQGYILMQVGAREML